MKYFILDAVSASWLDVMLDDVTAPHAVDQRLTLPGRRSNKEVRLVNLTTCYIFNELMGIGVYLSKNIYLSHFKFQHYASSPALGLG